MAHKCIRIRIYSILLLVYASQFVIIGKWIHKTEKKVEASCYT